MKIIKFFEFEIVESYFSFFCHIFNQDLKDLSLLPPFYNRLKKYKEITGYEVNGKRFYIKKYFNHFGEAESEWKNLFKLRSLGFSVPEPLFKRKSSDKIEIATFELKGIPLSKLLLKNKEIQEKLLYKLAELLSTLHKKGIYYQDCYLNHFFWNEKTGTLSFLDVSRILINPFFTLKYKIKDLSQLCYSFEEYFGDRGKTLFPKFLSYYLNLSQIKPTLLIKSLVKLKAFLIKWRTERAKKKGKIL